MKSSFCATGCIIHHKIQIIKTCCFLRLCHLSADLWDRVTFKLRTQHNCPCNLLQSFKTCFFAYQVWKVKTDKNTVKILLFVWLLCFFNETLVSKINIFTHQPSWLVDEKIYQMFLEINGIMFWFLQKSCSVRTWKLRQKTTIQSPVLNNACGHSSNNCQVCEVYLNAPWSPYYPLPRRFAV